MVVSLLLHLGLFWALAHWQHQVKLPEPEKKLPIMAKLMFLPKPKPPQEQPAEPAPEVEPEKQPEEKSQAKVQSEQAPENKQKKDKVQPKQQEAKEPQTAELVTQTPPEKAVEPEEQSLPAAVLPKATQRTNPRAIFNPRAEFKSLLDNQDKTFLEGIVREDPQPPSIKSINSYDDPQVKPLFDTQAQISPNARVINYNGTCVMIERALDHNGFSYNKWSGYSGGCGIEDKNLKALKLSLEKHVKKKQ